MKRNSLIIAISAAAISAALIAAPAIAWNKGDCNGYRNHPASLQGPGGMGKHQGPGMQGKHLRHDKGMLGAIEQLDLSEGQRDQIAAIIDANREARQGQREAHQQQRGELHALITAASWNQTTVESYAQRRADAIRDKIVARAEAHRQVYELLTPQQRSQLEGIREHRQAMGPQPNRP